MNGKEILLFFVIFASWFALNRWVLPWLGVPTCMSGSCSTGCSVPESFRDPGPNIADSDNVSEEAPPHSAGEKVPAGSQPALSDR
ncbi:MAG: hypothetical protein ACUVQQ_13595 [Thermogutta sp.]